jgi:hypothetical protein
MTLYGAHGQPLPPQQQPDSTLPPPQGMYHPYGRPPMDGAPQPLASSMPDPVRQFILAPTHNLGSNVMF